MKKTCSIVFLLTCILALTLVGGAAKSGIWCSLIAAAINRQISVSDENEACALGAAIIAAKGAGAYASFRDAVQSMAADTRSISTDEKLAAGMGEKYAKYRHMWDGIARYYS